MECTLITPRVARLGKNQVTIAYADEAAQPILAYGQAIALLEERGIEVVDAEGTMFWTLENIIVTSADVAQVSYRHHGGLVLLMTGGEDPPSLELVAAARGQLIGWIGLEAATEEILRELLSRLFPKFDLRTKLRPTIYGEYIWRNFKRPDRSAYIETEWPRDMRRHIKAEGLNLNQQPGEEQLHEDLMHPMWGTSLGGQSEKNTKPDLGEKSNPLTKGRMLSGQWAVFSPAGLNSDEWELVMDWLAANQLNMEALLRLHTFEFEGWPLEVTSYQLPPQRINPETLAELLRKSPLSGKINTTPSMGENNKGEGDEPKPTTQE